jgi:hypothetical protein
VHYLPASLLPWPPGCIQRLLPCKRCRVGPCCTSPKPTQSVRSPLRTGSLSLAAREPRSDNSRPPPVDEAEYHLQVLSDARSPAALQHVGYASAAQRAAGVSRLVPHALLRFLQPEDRLALGEGAPHPLRDRVRFFARERENVAASTVAAPAASTWEAYGKLESAKWRPRPLRGVARPGP